MKDLSKQFTVCFTIGPGRYWEYYNALSSMLELDPYVSNMLLVFNPYSAEDHESFFDIGEVRHANIIKTSSFMSLAKCWNQCIAYSETRYALVLNDDVVFQDPKALSKIYEKHKEGYEIVHATENWSGFSVDKKLIPKMGWFDERFAHSWEDADFRLRMKRADIKDFRFEPHLIRHTRSQRGRFQNQWDKSSKHFFDKWGIGDLLKSVGVDADIERPEIRKSLLMQGFFNDQFYDIMYNQVDEKLPTPDFYPELTKNYSIGNYGI